jgi:unsaturated chondroitin disaccharide hydrolase
VSQCGKQERDEYWNIAVKMLKSLSSPAYQSGDSKPSFLLHSTGHWPAGYKIDASIIYADYYYLEALLRYKKLVTGDKLVQIHE